MCKLDEYNKVADDDDDCNGYKVVAVRDSDGAYFSPATGMKYVHGKKIRAIKRQRSITSKFVNDLLIPGRRSFSELMVGRTAIFSSRETAIDLKADLYKSDSIRKGFTLDVVPARVATDVIRGFYNYGRVVAGRRIYFTGE